MHKVLIPFVAGLLCTATLIRAQVPKEISVSGNFDPNFINSSDADGLPCNAAGTFTLGTFTGQSNDTALDTIFLCFGDQIQIDHNGDYDLSGDPVPGTPPGVAWAFYTCPPTVMGDTYQSLLANEPCLLLGPSGAPVFAFGLANGDILFSNTGTLQTQYNGGQPILFHFAPITVDNFSQVQPFENNVVGAPPGPCLNVNTSVAFEVVYLNAITESGVSSNFGNDCLGKFRVSGGFPQWNPSARYTVDVSLQGNPNVKALVHTPPSQMGHNADIIFSVSQPGVYNVTIEDGKSCGHTFQITMNGCNPSDNALIALPDTVSPPGSQICIPITVENFSVVGASFSLDWDPAVLQFQGYQNSHPAIGTFNVGSNLNTQQAAQGLLGVVIYDQDVPGGIITIPNGEPLFELCFSVLGPLGSCSGIGVGSNPTLVNIENQMGQTVALSVDTGQVCVDFLPFNIAVDIIDVLCTGTASIRVSATGGTPGYDVTIESFTGGPTYSGTIANAGGFFIQDNIMPGTYEICVEDNNGGVGAVVACDTIVVNVPIVGVSLQNTKRPTCNGDMDGIVTAIVSVNGVAVPNPAPPTYTFNWLPAPSPTGAVYNSAAAGNYAVTVTDAATGCTATASGTLDQPQPVSDLTITITPASCSGVADGGITYVAEGGTAFPGGEYQYNWEYLLDSTGNTSQGPVGTDSLIVLTNLEGGTWYVTITDANGCSFTQEVNVPNQKTVEVTLTNAGPLLTLCAGESNGEICVQVVETPASANPNYSFFWTPIGFPQTAPTSTSSCYQDLPAGNYSVLAIDAAGCVDTANFTVGSPPVLNVSLIGVTQPSCFLPNGGVINVQATGGTNAGPNSYTYNWSPAPATTGATVSNLPPGDYTVTVTDLNGCEDTLTVTLNVPIPPQITAVDSTSVKCGNDGSISITSPTGITYQWVTIDGVPVAGGDSSAIFNLQGDTFIVTINDNQGCVTVDTFWLEPVTPMSFSDTTLTEPSCFGYNDGLIGVSVVDGNPPYTYQWSVDSLGQGTPTLISIPAGDYVVTVSDLEGCTLVGNFTLGQPPQILVNFGVPDSTSCFAICDGAVEVTVNYADNTSGDFNFVWSDIGAGDSTRNDLCADTVNVIAIDGNNCFGVDTLIIPGPPEVTYDTLYTIPTTCNGGDDGQAVIEGTGGNGSPYSYVWSSGSTSNTATNLLAEEYNVTVTDNSGCTAVFTAEVTEPEPIVVEEDSTSRKPVKCNGGDDGQLGVTVSGGNVGGYTFSWADEDSMIISVGQLAENLTTGIYSVTVTDSKGCTGELQNLFLDEPPPVFGEYLPWDEIVCNGDETTLYIDTIYGGSGGPYLFSLDFGVTLNQDFPVSLSGGEHYITYFDRNLCEYIDTIFVLEPDPIVVTFNPPTFEIELGDTTYQLKPLITGAVVDTFLWFPSETLRDPSDLTPFVHTYSTETYTLTVFDANGCEGSGSILIEVDPNRNVFIPNVFKPGNESGLNDHLNVMVGLGVEHVNFMRIYDRWGGLMYERNDFYPNNDNLAEGWDGRYRGDYVNPGVFVYLVEVRFLDGKVLLYRGDVTVVR